jgi:hypothetical protein
LPEADRLASKNSALPATAAAEGDVVAGGELEVLDPLCPLCPSPLPPPQADSAAAIHTQ